MKIALDLLKLQKLFQLYFLSFLLNTERSPILNNSWSSITTTFTVLYDVVSVNLI